MQELADIVANVRIGEWHDVGVALALSSQSRMVRYKILEVKKHHDYAYSLYCIGYDDKGKEGVIYQWVVPKFATQFSTRVTSITPVES